MARNTKKSGSFLVLGSASPRRHDLLGRLGVPFECMEATGVDESLVTGPAKTVVRTLAQQKAEDVLRKLLSRGTSSEPWRVLGADTLVASAQDGEEQVLGKPRDRDHACAMLERLSGSVHHVYTGVALARPDAPPRVETECTQVTFRSLRLAEIEKYVDGGEAMGKAGAYGIQGQGEEFVAMIRGCYYNVVGLPLMRTARLLGIPFACDCSTHALQRGDEGCESA